MSTTMEKVEKFLDTSGACSSTARACRELHFAIENLFNNEFMVVWFNYQYHVNEYFEEEVTLLVNVQAEDSQPRRVRITWNKAESDAEELAARKRNSTPNLIVGLDIEKAERGRSSSHFQTLLDIENYPVNRLITFKREWVKFMAQMKNLMPVNPHILRYWTYSGSEIEAVQISAKVYARIFDENDRVSGGRSGMARVYNFVIGTPEYVLKDSEVDPVKLTI